MEQSPHEPRYCPRCRHNVESYLHLAGCGWANKIKSPRPHWHHFCCNHKACGHEWITELPNGQSL